VTDRRFATAISLIAEQRLAAATLTRAAEGSVRR